jgi:hypothetical protein
MTRSIQRGKRVSCDLKDVLEILQEGDNKKLNDARKVKPPFLDIFLYSGRFNSVLGLDGFQLFKSELRDVVKKVNDNDFNANYIKLDRMFEVLISSGVYYEESFMPEELDFLKVDKRWLTAYRYIAKNFPQIQYKDFRSIVKRFQDSDGHSFFLADDDSQELVKAVNNEDLFKHQMDAMAALLQLSQKELKAICEKLEVAAARSIEDTAKRIVEAVGDKSLELIPSSYKGNRTIFIKDIELATGQDIIQLDTYLRQISKVVRDDLIAFIDRQRNGIFAA